MANTSLLDETKVETLDTQSLHIEMLRRLIIDGQLGKNGLKAIKDGIAQMIDQAKVRKQSLKVEIRRMSEVHKAVMAEKVERLKDMKESWDDVKKRANEEVDRKITRAGKIARKKLGQLSSEGLPMRSEIPT